MPKNSSSTRLACQPAMKAKDVLEALARPFHPSLVRWRVPENTIGTRLRDRRRFGRALAYIDARAVIDRFNEVLSGNWSSSLTPVTEDGQVTGFLCALTLVFPDGTSATRTDIGYVDPNLSGDMALKAGASDALKRAAVQFGVGQYLYSLEMPQVEVDSSGRIVGPYPEMPAEIVDPYPEMPAEAVTGVTADRKEAPRLEASTRLPRKRRCSFRVIQPQARPEAGEACRLDTPRENRNTGGRGSRRARIRFIDAD